MPTDSNPMAEFFERAGHRTFRTETSWWYEVWPGSAFSLPYHHLIQPDRSEIERLIRDHKMRLVRYPTPLEAFGFPNTLEVRTDPNFDLSSLEREAGRQTRQGLKQCTFQRIDFDYLREHGIVLNRGTAERQGRKTIYCDPDYWRRYCDAGKATEKARAWGVFAEGQLASYLVELDWEGWSNWHLVHSSVELLKKRPNNVLFYEATRQLLASAPGYKICYGLGSVEPTPALDRFKVHMGISVLPIKNRLIFSGTARLAVAFARPSFLWLLRKVFPKSYAVRKGAAIMELHRRQFAGRPESDAQADGIGDG